MKVMPGHYDALKTAIEHTFTVNGGKDHIIAAYESGNIYNADKVKNLQRRFCFDMLWAADCDDLVQEIYLYANDNHIYTALKRICPKVERKY